MLSLIIVSFKQTQLNYKALFQYPLSVDKLLKQFLLTIQY